MSKIGDYLQYWLKEGGYDLGSSEYEIPKLADMADILKNNVKVWEYYKVTERQYYAGKRVPR